MYRIAYYSQDPHALPTHKIYFLIRSKGRVRNSHCSTFAPVDPYFHVFRPLPCLFFFQAQIKIMNINPIRDTS